MNILILVLFIGLVSFVVGYFVGMGKLKDIVDSHKEYEIELKKQRDDWQARFNYLAFGNTEGKYTFVRDK